MRVAAFVFLSNPFKSLSSNNNQPGGFLIGDRPVFTSQSFKNLTKALLFVFNVPQGPPLVASQRPGFPRPFSIDTPQPARWRSKPESLRIGLRNTIPRNHLKNHLKHPQGPPFVTSQKPGFPRPFSIDAPQSARWRSKPESLRIGLRDTIPRNHLKTT